jgi:hypothetical protein
VEYVLTGDQSGPLGGKWDHRLRKSGSGMWKAGTSKVIALACVG